MAKKNEFDLIIIGAGVAGLSGAMYAARLGLKTLCLGKSSGSEMPIGGVITTTNLVENYPGFTSISGNELAENIRKHAKSYDLVDIREEKVMNVKENKGIFNVETEKEEYFGKTILFATGTKWKKLEVKGGQEFENKGVNYCALCQPPGEEIITNSNIIPIENVTPSTSVLTGDGSYQSIGGFSKREYDGELIGIKPRFFVETTKLTPEHPVLTVQVKKGVGSRYLEDFKFGEPTWKEAKDLNLNDCVVYPIIKKTEDKEYINLSDYLELRAYEDKVIPHKRTWTSKLINNRIILNKNIMRLFGYYLAEGSAVRHELRFYFAKDEQEYINDVAKIIKESFGLEPRISYKDNVGIVSLYSKMVCDLFKVLFDKYSYMKRLPQFIMHLPEEKQKELIMGLWRGDGCSREKDFCLVTNSRKLAYQVRDILLRLGIICSLQKRDKEKLNLKPHQIAGRDVSFTHDKYHLSVGGQFLEKMSSILEFSHPLLKTRQFSTNHAWINENMAVLPIREIKKEKYIGEVLSLAIENNSSYVAKNFIVHNCDAPLYRNKVVAVIGGSDSAAKDALVLAEQAKKVYIIYRREKIRPEPVNLKRVESNPKIEVINNANVLEVKGDKIVRSVILDREYNGKKELELNGVFVAIGHIVLSELAKKLGVKLNEKEEIIINHKNSETNIPGVFAAGDVTDKHFKQAITGVADACTGAYSAFEFISKKNVEG
ncbi:MAG: FAD-dependent oxidoreductase [Nanoarchaeota archaeon]